ncbi:hypothetical protein ACFXKW_36960 [Streptomyces sp. NPDC059193]|uniref:hypothetical protein n=1 Tax=Streptomyces sp. NPDC059193 TaxID=3346763 RepID=UPI0036948189
MTTDGTPTDAGLAGRCDGWCWDTPQPSQALLDRARVGWERFVRSFTEPSDD